VFDHLQIYDRRERALVGIVDIALQGVGLVGKTMRPRGQWPPRRILLLRLERIGDLVMALEAIEDVRHAAPAAEIDLVVGSWNDALARRIKGIARVETLDAAWLSRDGAGLPMRALVRRARAWRQRRYDLGVNFEPDLRSNFLLAESRAARTAGFSSGGGGGLLDVALRYDPRAHTASNAQRLVAAVMDVPPRLTPARIELAAEERRRARERIGAARGPVVGVHVSGGRAIKQWDPERFRELALRLARARGATIVLTGSAGDRALVEPVARALADLAVVDLAGALDLPGLAAVLEQLDVFVTGDTGPMHVAAAVGTPVVAIFGPSDPARYAPRDAIHRIVRVDLPCSPCNRIRLPPDRCAGHIPDCLTGIDVEMVFRAVEATLDRSREPAARSRSAQR
jgi:lipopolysaccharide heptosyltransferase II